MSYDDMTDEALIALAKDGDEVSMETILERYKSMVKKHARTLYLIGGDNDDLIQEGMIALYKAIRGYDENSDSKFSPYASTCISHHLYNVIRGANRLKNSPLNTSISLDAPLGDANGEANTRTIADTLPPDALSDPEAILIDRENVLDIKEALAKTLSSLERSVVKRYIDGATLSDISKELSRSPKSVDNALQRAKAKLISKKG